MKPFQTRRIHDLLFPAKVSGLALLLGLIACDDGPPPILDARVYRSLDASGDHTCGITIVNELACFGRDTFGQSTPPDGEFGVVASGAASGCAINATGQLSCWGWNDDAQSSPPPGTFVAVTVGFLHACALNDARGLTCWGCPEDAVFVTDEGALDCSTSSDPWERDGRFIAVSAGRQNHTCAIDADGRIQCFGNADDGRLRAPEGQYAQLSAGVGHTCAVGADGDLACFGANESGQLDAPSGNFTAVTSGAFHSCALDADGFAQCWGLNASGQTDAPADIPFQSITAGDHHSCAIQPDGRVQCWGRDDSGQSSPE